MPRKSESASMQEERRSGVSRHLDLHFIARFRVRTRCEIQRNRRPLARTPGRLRNWRPSRAHVHRRFEPEAVLQDAAVQGRNTHCLKGAPHHGLWSPPKAHGGTGDRGTDRGRTRLETARRSAGIARCRPAHPYEACAVRCNMSRIGALAGNSLAHPTMNSSAALERSLVGNGNGSSGSKSKARFSTLSSITPSPET